MAPQTDAPRLRWHPGMTDEQLAAQLAEPPDPHVARILATAPKDLAPDEAARIARLLWPAGRAHEKSPSPLAVRGPGLSAVSSRR
jgi:hypothetical protein